jgi:hypothetical protein
LRDRLNTMDAKPARGDGAAVAKPRGDEPAA